ncbi:MAG: histidinol-phosphate transaminase [Candidatus Margulisiibacteriota bacterium]
MNEDSVRPAIKGLKEYVPGKNPDRAGVIKLASNENPMGASPKAIKAMETCFKDLPVYPDQHSTRLKQALANKFSLSPDNFIIGNGSDEVMQFVAATYLSAGEEVILPKNVFSTYEFVTLLFDGVAKFVDLKDYKQDLNDFAQNITPKTKLVFICNPVNPTGTMVGKAELDGFLSKAPKNVIVVLDEAYCEYGESADFPDSLKYVNERENVVVLRTFSKLYGLAGIRVGYGVAHPRTIKYLSMTKMPFNVNRLAEAGAVAALDDSKHVEQTLKTNKEGKAYLYKELEALGIEFIKTEANFIFVNIKNNADDLFLKMMGEKIIIRPLTSFGFPQAFRVSIGTMEQNKKFISALKKVI